MEEQTKPYEANLERQLRIKNWGVEQQNKIRDSKVLIIGDGILEEMILGSMLGLGVGNILFFDKKEGGKSYLAKNNKKDRIDQILTTTKEISPFSKISGYSARFSNSLLDYEEFIPSFIIDSTNDFHSKEKSLEYAIERDINYISVYSNKRKSVLTYYDKNKNNIEEILSDFGITKEDKEQGSIISGINAGIITDELRKSLFKLESFDHLLDRKIIYNLDSKNRKSLDSDNQIDYDFSSKKILVAGAGAIGNFVALNLALSGFRNIDIIDNDKIEPTNLNRQILYYGKEGKNKAPTLSQRIKELAEINSRAFVYKLEKSSGDFFKKNSYDLIFGCFDNLKARYYLNEFALEFKIPYIDGGTAEFIGSASVYNPTKTPCIKCKKNIEEPKTELRRSCAATPLASVIIPNIAIGSAMVGEAINLLAGEINEHAIVYDTFNRNRIFRQIELKSKQGCKCNSGVVHG